MISNKETQKKLKIIKKAIRRLHEDSWGRNHNYDLYGNSFVTTYQIAMKIKEEFPNEFELFDLPIGGKGTGQNQSLAQYIGSILSKGISQGWNLFQNIEVIRLEKRFLNPLVFTFEEEDIYSSETNYNITLYRLRSRVVKK